MNELHTGRLRVATLKELDALVGKYLTRETPAIFWEEQHACLRFDSIEEALEAMHDPYYQQFIPREARPQSALTEVQEYRPYSSDLTLTWALVQQLCARGENLCVRQEEGRWVAAFGEARPATSDSAMVAICAAALQSCGWEVELAIDSLTPPAAPANSSPRSASSGH